MMLSNHRDLEELEQSLTRLSIRTEESSLGAGDEDAEVSRISVLGIEEDDDKEYTGALEKIQRMKDELRVMRMDSKDLRHDLHTMDSNLNRVADTLTSLRSKGLEVLERIEVMDYLEILIDKLRRYGDSIRLLPYELPQEYCHRVFSKYTQLGKGKSIALKEFTAR